MYGGERSLERIGALIREAREAGAPVIYVQHCEGPGDFLEPGAEGWKIHSSVTPLDGELVIRKRTPGSFHETDLQKELDVRGISRLILTGIQTECCVDTTCRRAFSMGYEVVLAKDGQGMWDTDHLSAPQIKAHHNEVLGGWFAETVEAGAVEIQATPASVNF